MSVYVFLLRDVRESLPKKCQRNVQHLDRYQSEKLSVHVEAL